MTEHHIEIREATKPQAAEIASLIMMAMTDDCCLYFCGDGHGLEDFRSMMTMLVEREDSQYSYRNTLIAMDGDKVVGISVSYDGAVLPEYRRQGIASALLLATKERADQYGLPCVGLLVDNDNPDGEALYSSVGFRYVGDNRWGGHPMKHMIL